MKCLPAILALAICFPAAAAAQNLTATLRVQGDVMVAATGDFQTAADNQQVVVGQRILVGENATATVRYGSDCSRTYSDPGVYTIEPGKCRDKKDRKQDQQDAGSEGDVASSGGSSLGSISTILGAALVGAEAIRHQQESKPDRALSR